MPVLVTYKFEEDQIKTEGVSKDFHHSRASNSKVNGPIWSEIEFIRDFMLVLVTNKFNKDLIKNEHAS